MRENCVLQPFCSQHAICLSYTQLKLTFQLQLKFDHQHTTLDTPATAPRCIPASLAQRHGHLVSHVSRDVKEHLHLEKRRLRDERIRTVTIESSDKESIRRSLSLVADAKEGILNVQIIERP